MVKKEKMIFTFKNTQNLKVIEFEIFRNSKYVSNIYHNTNKNPNKYIHV
jgi:hypothetical protein